MIFRVPEAQCQKDNSRRILSQVRKPRKGETMLPMKGNMADVKALRKIQSTRGADEKKADGHIVEDTGQLAGT